MKCKNCGTSNLKGAKFCEKCGASLIETGICPNCGHKNKPAALHCIECGTALAQAEVKTPKPEVETITKAETSKPKRAISPVIWVLGGVFGVIILCLAAFLLGMIKVPVPPEPNTSVLPAFVVSAWKGAYQYQTTGSFSLPVAETGPGYVEALFNCDESGKSPVSATTGDKIHDVIGWTAGTQTQVEDFLKYIQFSVFVDGNKAIFQGPFQYEIKFDAQKNSYNTPTLVVLDSLTAGTHHIKTEITWSQKFYDGEAYYGPGSNNEKLVGNCTVVVKNPTSVSTNKPADQQQEQPVVVPPQGGGCNRLVTKAECEQGGGTWGGFLKIGTLGEKYCICKNDPQDPAQRDKTWCVGQGGTWVEEQKECSFVSSCTQYQDKNSCEANNGSWITDKDGGFLNFPGSSICFCASFNKNPVNSCSITDQMTVGDMVYDSSTDKFRVEISQPTGFPDGSDFDIKVSANNKQIGEIACQKSDTNKMLCEQDALPEFKQNWPGADLNICRDVYCCVNMGKVNIKTPSGNLFTLTGDCPPAGSITSENMQWQKGKILLDVINPNGWETQEYTPVMNIGTQKWTDLKCTVNKLDNKILKCIGWGTYKTGGASLSMNFAQGGNQCSFSGVPVELWNRCSTPGYGYCAYLDACCPSGTICCPKGCYPTSSYTHCP